MTGPLEPDSPAIEPETRPMAELRATRHPPDTDVRARELPPVAGPNVRNLLVATGLLLAVLAATMLFLPGKARRVTSERTAPPPPESTFLDQPLPLDAAGGEQPLRGPWWDRIAVRPDPGDEVPEPEAQTFQFPAWDETGVASGPVAPPPPPRQAAFERALKSSALRRVEAPAAALPGPAPPSDPLSAAAALLPAAGEIASLAGALAHPAVSSPPAAPLSQDTREPFRLATRLFAPGRMLRAGTVIAARLEAGIDSDSPGPVTARVLRDVTDSATGRVVLIPAGAQLLGSVSSQLAYGENRVLVAFDRMSFAGRSFELPSLAAVEATGGAGLADEVDRHTWSTLGRAVLLAAVGAGYELSQPERSERAALTSGEIVAAQVALELNRVAGQILSRGLDRRPTVRIRSGERFYVYVHRDLEL